MKINEILTENESQELIEYSGTKVPSLRSIAPPSADNSSNRAEGAPLLL